MSDSPNLTLLRHAASIQVPERTQQVDYGWCQVHGGVGRTCRVLCRCPEPSAESSRVKAAGVRANARGCCCCCWWSRSRAADAQVSTRFVTEKWDWKTVLWVKTLKDEKELKLLSLWASPPLTAALGVSGPVARRTAKLRVFVCLVDVNLQLHLAQTCPGPYMSSDRNVAVALDWTY